MSVKIYDGLIATAADPFRVAAEIREVLEPLFLSDFAVIHDHIENLSPLAPWGDTDYFFGHDSIDRRALYYSMWNKMRELHDSGGDVFAKGDIFYTVVLLQNGNYGGLPLVVFDGNARYRKALLESGVVESYGYWDNTDWEEGVSEEEWLERANAWSVVEDDGPIDVGLSFGPPSSLACANHLALACVKKAEEAA